MLIVRSAIQKVLPASMHSRWDTWSAIWLPEKTVLPTLVASFVPPFIGTSSNPVLLGTLCCAGMLGLNASFAACQKRNRQEWTLPHDAWKNACAKVEAKLQGIVHMPHIYRTSALCDLSFVLKDAELERLCHTKELSLSPTADIALYSRRVLALGEKMNDWTEGYTTGTISALLLKPHILDEIHANLNFDEHDIYQWVEASYLQRVHEDLKEPLPGTIDAISVLANENPATMAFYMHRYADYFDRKRKADEKVRIKWDATPSFQWFAKTQWPALVAMMQDLQVKCQSPESLQDEYFVLSPLDCYRQVMNGKNVERGPAIDGILFEMDAPGA